MKCTVCYHCLGLLAGMYAGASSEALQAPSVLQHSGNPRGLAKGTKSHADGRITVESGIFQRVQQIPRGGGDSGLDLSPNALALAETLAPSVGVLTSTALYFAPFAAVLSAIRADDIGDLNPLPLAIMSVVGVAWLAYGLSIRDKYVTISNILGSIGSIGYVVGLLPLLSKNKSQLRTTQAVVLAGSAFTLCLWTALGLSGASATRISSSLGLFASSLFIILSGSPLSTIKTVLATKDSASILGPLTAAQVANTSLWSAYGLAKKDVFVWGPNIAGLGLGLIQLALKILFPAKKSA